MRVRHNFTIDVDVEQYNEATGQCLSKDQVRKEIQESCITAVLEGLADVGVKASMLGRNNVYDPIQRLTVAEHLVTT